MRIFTESEQKARVFDHKTHGVIIEIERNEGDGAYATYYSMSFQKTGHPNDGHEGYTLLEKDIPNDAKVPKVGDSITLYSDDYISPFRGCDFNGTPFLYYTSREVAIDSKLHQIFGIDCILNDIVAIMPELSDRQRQMVVAQIPGIRKIIEELESLVKV